MIKLWNNKFKIDYAQWLDHRKFLIWILKVQTLMYRQHPRENIEDTIYLWNE